jgi:hypothetical protein
MREHDEIGQNGAHQGSHSIGREILRFARRCGAVISRLIDVKAVEMAKDAPPNPPRLRGRKRGVRLFYGSDKRGAEVVTGGKRAAQGGSFFEPTVLSDVTTDMVITKGGDPWSPRRSTVLRPRP